MTEHGSEETIELPRSSTSKPRLFGREKSVHELLGGGKCADTLLWRKKHYSAGVLGIATLAYVLFEWCNYTVISVACNALLFSTILLFLWSNGAAFLNRPGPRIPEMQLSEDFVQHVAHSMKHEINKVVQVLRQIVLGRDWVLFLKASVGLWLISVVGSWCDLLTLVYIVTIIAHVVPLVYDKYEDHIEHYANRGFDEGKKYYKKVDEVVMKRIPRAGKEKKAQ